MRQTSLPMSDDSHPAPGLVETPEVAGTEASAIGELRAPATALLGVVTELAGRYSPDRLAVSAGSERVGLAGWIIDRALGLETDVDEDAAKLAIAALCDRELVKVNAAGRLEATEKGVRLWGQLKPA